MRAPCQGFYEEVSGRKRTYCQNDTDLCCSFRYDKTQHHLRHNKCIMLCSFCPELGSPAGFPPSSPGSITSKIVKLRRESPSDGPHLDHQRSDPRVGSFSSNNESRTAYNDRSPTGADYDTNLYSLLAAETTKKEEWMAKAHRLNELLIRAHKELKKTEARLRALEDHVEELLVEKSFNPADVFTRHLTAVHGVEQTPPRRFRKPIAMSPYSAAVKKLADYALDVTARCSTCAETFNNGQELYDHLDNCKLQSINQGALHDTAEEIDGLHRGSSFALGKRRCSSSGNPLAHSKPVVKKTAPMEDVDQSGTLGTQDYASSSILAPSQHDDRPTDRGGLSRTITADFCVSSMSSSPTRLPAAALIWLRLSCASPPRTPMVDVSF